MMGADTVVNIFYFLWVPQIYCLQTVFGYFFLRFVNFFLRSRLLVCFQPYSCYFVFEFLVLAMRNYE